MCVKFFDTFWPIYLFTVAYYLCYCRVLGTFPLMYNQPGREALQVHSIVALDHKSHDLDQRVHPIISRDIQQVVPLGVNNLLLRNPAERSSPKQRCVCVYVSCLCVCECVCSRHRVCGLVCTCIFMHMCNCICTKHVDLLLFYLYVSMSISLDLYHILFSCFLYTDEGQYQYRCTTTWRTNEPAKVHRMEGEISSSY